MEEKFIIKAKEELREEPNRKAQALIQFREWIEKHQFIKSCRQGHNRIYFLKRVQ